MILGYAESWHPVDGGIVSSLKACLPPSPFYWLSARWGYFVQTHCKTIGRYLGLEAFALMNLYESRGKQQKGFFSWAMDLFILFL